MTDSARYGWTVLLPVKVLAQAKSRLAQLAGERRHQLPPPLAPHPGSALLALPLAADTVSAVLACQEVDRVIVVTSDQVAGVRLTSLGALAIPDPAPGA